MNNLRKALNNWQASLFAFAKREYHSILIWSALGALAAGVVRLSLLGHSLEGFARANYLPSSGRFDDARLYFPYFLTIALLLVVAAAIRFPDELHERG